MKITKQHLKQIIKEELSKVLNEMEVPVGAYSGPKTTRDTRDYTPPSKSDPISDDKEAEQGKGIVIVRDFKKNTRHSPVFSDEMVNAKAAAIKAINNLNLDEKDKEYFIGRLNS
tara:strand:- start:200 stop:541 length:342 start_codon:yes stop_codon:yes gene_type:complete